MEEVEIIRESITKLYAKYRILEKENIKLKEDKRILDILERENKELKRAVEYKDRKIECLKTRLVKKTTAKVKRKYKWDDECVYYELCKKADIRKCKECNKTGIYEGDKLKLR